MSAAYRLPSNGPDIKLLGELPFNRQHIGLLPTIPLRQIVPGCETVKLTFWTLNVEYLPIIDQWWWRTGPPRLETRGLADTRTRLAVPCALAAYTRRRHDRDNDMSGVTGRLQHAAGPVHPGHGGAEVAVGVGDAPPRHLHIAVLRGLDHQVVIHTALANTRFINFFQIIKQCSPSLHRRGTPPRCWTSSCRPPCTPACCCWTAAAGSRHRTPPRPHLQPGQVSCY